MHYEAILTTPRMLQQLRYSNTTTLKPSCEMVPGSAAPPPRLISLARQREDLGADSMPQARTLRTTHRPLEGQPTPGPRRPAYHHHRWRSRGARPLFLLGARVIRSPVAFKPLYPVTSVTALITVCTVTSGITPKHLCPLTSGAAKPIEYGERRHRQRSNLG